MKKNLINLFFLNSLQFLILFIAAATSSSSFSPTDHYLVNCGSVDPTVVDPDHRRFTGDGSEPASRFLETPSPGTIIRVTDSDLGPDSSPLYHTARVFTRPAKYGFAIRGSGTYHFIRLHFHRVSSSVGDFSLAKFHVLANGFLLLSNYSHGNEGNSNSNSNSNSSPVVKEFIIRVDSDWLEITFVPVKRSNLAFVNAIEVISAPKDLILDAAQLVSSSKNERIEGLFNRGFETVYRVNVGGPKVTPFNDSLWRTWIPDEDYLKSEALDVHFHGRIQYQAGGASREVGPDNMYNSGRVIKSSSDSIPTSNITWKFPILGGSNDLYLVRLHFCDIASITSYLLYFNVYVNKNLAYENLDLSRITNGDLASPFFADFVVHGLSSEESEPLISVTIGPSNSSLPRTVDGILNGVEVFAMSNSFKSFGGAMCAHSAMESWRGGNGAALLPLFAAVFLLLSAFALVVPKKRFVADSIGWSPLPVDVSEIVGLNQSSGKV